MLKYLLRALRGAEGGPDDGARAATRPTRPWTRVLADGPGNGPSAPPRDGPAPPRRRDLSESCPELDGSGAVPPGDSDQANPTGRTPGRRARRRPNRPGADIGRDRRRGGSRKDPRSSSSGPAGPSAPPGPWECSKSCPDFDGNRDVPPIGSDEAHPTDRAPGGRARRRRNHSGAKIGRDCRRGKSGEHANSSSSGPARLSPPTDGSSRAAGRKRRAHRRRSSAGLSFSDGNAPPDGHGDEKAPLAKKRSPDDATVDFRDWNDYSESDRLFGIKAEDGSEGSSRSLAAVDGAEDATHGGFDSSEGATPEGNNASFATSGGGSQTSPYVAVSDTSENAGPSSPRPVLRRPNSISYSLAPGISPASSHFAAKAEIENIRGLEKELLTLSTAAQSYPKNSHTWLMLHSYLDQAREELDAILQDIQIHPHTIHIMAPSGNLGLVVDKPEDGGPVYVRSLHPLSPLKDRVRPNDKIVAIDGEDVQQLSPIEVGKLLCRITGKEKRKVSIVRDDVLVGYGGLDRTFNWSTHTCCTGISLEEMESDFDEQSLSGFFEEKDLSSAEEQESGSDETRCLPFYDDLREDFQSGSMEESDTNQSLAAKSGSDYSSDEEDEEMHSRVYPQTEAEYSSNEKRKMDRKDDAKPPQSAVEIISSVKQFLKQLADDDLSPSSNHSYPKLTTITPEEADRARPEISGVPERLEVAQLVTSSGTVEEEIKTWYADFRRKSRELKAMEKVSTEANSAKAPRPMSASQKFKMNRRRRLAKAAERSMDSWDSWSDELRSSRSQPPPVSSDDDQESSSLTSGQWKKLRKAAARECRSHGRKIEI